MVLDRGYMAHVMNVALASLFLLILSHPQQAGFADDENSTKSVLNTVLSWHLYDFSPDDVIVTKSLSVVDEKPRTLFFDGNSSSIEFDSPLVNTTHIITAATIKPLFDGKDDVIVNVPDKFNLELKNHTEGYYLTMEIRENSLWHVFQFPNPIFENYTHVFGMYDGQTVTLGINGEYKTYRINQDENNVFDDSKYVEFEKIPSDTIYYNETTVSHIHIGEMHYHGRHYNFFLGQIGDVVIYPIQNYTSSLLFTQTNSTFTNNVGIITTQTNVTEIP
ncbi:hypothetical protein, partial [Nitrosotalea sinensis]|uniref:hypothetical protein n=1 Tax=Nitrosotalea sinensis TaxID=1499975 RepID=UPI0010568780